VEKEMILPDIAGYTVYCSAALMVALAYTDSMMGLDSGVMYCDFSLQPTPKSNIDK
jgi:hypothetical protein